MTANSLALADTLRTEFDIDAVHVGNGVDLSAFRNPGPPATDLPADPFAVYVGTVQDRVDFALLDAAAAELPVVIAGPAADPFAARLRAGPYRWLGPLPHEQIPALLHAASVGLVPHRLDAFTASMEPIKVFEYLASGLPVVSTRLPGLERFRPAISFADDADSFGLAVRIASIGRRHDPVPGLRDWDDVARELFAIHAGELAK